MYLPCLSNGSCRNFHCLLTVIGRDHAHMATARPEAQSVAPPVAATGWRDNSPLRHICLCKQNISCNSETIIISRTSRAEHSMTTSKCNAHLARKTIRTPRVQRVEIFRSHLSTPLINPNGSWGIRLTGLPLAYNISSLPALNSNPPNG